MSNLLAGLFSYGDTLKRKVNDAVKNPKNSLLQFIGQLGDDINRNSNLMNQAGYFPIDKKTYTPAEQAAARAQLGDIGANMAMAGMFVGKGSKTWDALSANKAEAMEKAGADARKIWSETGTWKGPDGMWRQEIPDNKSFYVGSKAGGGSYSDDVLLHPELYKSYPNTAKSRVIESQLEGGNFDPVTRKITVGPRDAGSTMIHEQQHQIQELEGFAKGGAPENFDQQDVATKARDMLNWQKDVKAQLEKNPSLDWRGAENAAIKEYESIGWPEAIPSGEVRKMASNPLAYFESQPEDFVKLYGLDKRTTPYTGNDLYKRLAGEAEARATQARMPLDAAQRRALFPEDSYDIPLNQLIVRGVLGK